MRICMSFLARGHVPTHYNYLVQSAIYHRLPGRISRALHEKGIREGPRHFKMFTFSRLYGDFTRDQEGLLFRDRAYLCFSSPLERVATEVYRSFLVDPVMRLDNAELMVEVMKVVEEPEFTSSTLVYTLSPITVYRKSDDGIRYYSPYELEWGALVDLNAKRKYHALKGRYLKSGLQVRPLNAGLIRVKYKDNLIMAWKGEFQMRGPKSLQRVVYEAGMGSKNSQGFGMIEVKGRRMRDLLSLE
ncbi:CRISPR-associated endoribonuclease Cas6 [Metallosphaera javensis (ex Sakai et al. 2022)]|uniref:CRISPR-associated endoribonuclease Cas6 n=1 Tax=Metallosphaera javensis (ex Sakai et al. 2022) TaxID=2775498 RepID=UPI00258B3223|nr:MAG: CRISPR-associated endoribonuclease Cas6 [Metallosphaera javensis (ex Sakai et al. 2022)]